MDFPQLLQRFLQIEGLSQADFALRVNVRPSQVCEWLAGKAKPGYDSLKAICRAFDLPAEYWLGLGE